MLPTLPDIAERLAAGEPLDDEAARALVASTDIVSLGTIADRARRARHGVRVTFVRVADVGLDDDAWPESAGEARLLARGAPFETALARVRGLVSRAGPTPVTAFSLDALDVAARDAGVTLADALARLSYAGLAAIAMAPIDVLGDRPHVFATLAESRLPLARLTVEVGGEPVTLCRQAAAVQEQFGCVRAFAPLGRRLSTTQPTTGYDDVKRVALARLLVGAVETIQVDWSLYGPKLAQVALTFGADDLDAVSPIDDESRGWRRAPLEEVRRNITAAGLSPVERDGRFSQSDVGRTFRSAHDRAPNSPPPAGAPDERR